MNSSEYHLLIVFAGVGSNNKSLNSEHNREWNCPELKVKFRKSLIEKRYLCVPPVYSHEDWQTNPGKLFDNRND